MHLKKKQNNNNKTKKVTYIPVPAGTDMDSVSNLSIFSNTRDPSSHL